MWGLAITPLTADVRVVADGSAPVLVRVLPVETPLGTPRLFSGESLTVSFGYREGMGVMASSLVLPANMPFNGVDADGSAGGDAGNVAR